MAKRAYLLGGSHRPRIANVPYELVFYEALRDQGFVRLRQIDAYSQTGVEPERAEIEVFQETLIYTALNREDV